MKDSNVAQLTIEDFPTSTSAGQLFIAYVKICIILGDFTKFSLRSQKSSDQQCNIRNALYRWIKTLPDSLRLCHSDATHSLKPYTFEVRQLHVLYFATLTILDRPLTLEKPPPTAAILASSFVAGLFEDFLARDELRLLGPIFTFYLLAAAITQLSSYRYTGLWQYARENLRVIATAQEELTKRWPSALGSVRTYNRIRNLAMTQRRLDGFPENNLTTEQAAFFDDFGSELCREWNVLCGKGNVTAINTARDSSLGNFVSGSGLPNLSTLPVTSSALAVDEPGLMLEQDDGQSFGNVVQDPLTQFGEIGDWLCWNTIDC